MNRNYTLTEGDDIREIPIRLSPAMPIPTEAILILTRIIEGVEIRIERELEYDSEASAWRYRFTDDDFLELIAGNWKGKVYATFADGANATYPTTVFMKVKVYKTPLAEA